VRAVERLAENLDAERLEAQIAQRRGEREERRWREAAVVAEIKLAQLPVAARALIERAAQQIVVETWSII
jgi:hypothetical protein